MAEKISSANDFRVVDGRYIHNNEEISKEEFDKRRAAANQAMQDLRSSPTPGFEGADDAMKRLREQAEARRKATGKKAGGVIKSASSRADGCAQRGKTKGRMV